jgi:hypothetical protein
MFNERLGVNHLDTIVAHSSLSDHKPALMQALNTTRG